MVEGDRVNARGTYESLKELEIEEIIFNLEI